MAYVRNESTGNGSSNQGNARPAQGGYSKPAPRQDGTPSRDASSKGFEKDPNEVGIAYLKTSEKVGEYFSISITGDIPAGAKLVMFENKVKNRTEKTPTHVVKLSIKKN